MGVSLSQLIDRTRIDSGLRNNQLFSDVQIASLLTDAYSDLRDKMIVRFAYWFKSTFEFSLTGGSGNNVLSLSEIPDLEMVQGVVFVDGSGNEFPVNMIGSIEQRNRLMASAPFFVGGGFNGYTGRGYFIDGDDLEVLPPANSAGSYKVIYTPQPKTFEDRQSATYDMGDAVGMTVGRIIAFTQGDHVDGPSRTWTFDKGDFIRAGTVPGALLNVTTGAQTGFFTVQTVVDETTVVTFETPVTETFSDSDSFGIDDVLQFSFPNAEFTDSMIDGNVTIDFTDLFNGGLNGTYAIFDVLSDTTIQIPVYLPSAALTLPTEGTVSVDWQNPGTINELPDALTPWSKYLVLVASIAIRTSRGKKLADLAMQLKRFEDRIVAITKQRSEGVRQAQITRNYYGNGRGGFLDV